MKKSDSAPARILLVDDNLLGSSARRMILTEAGYAVEMAGNGEEAWELFQRGRFDLVVTDYKMPGMNGVELIRLIRAAEAPVRIILLSGRIATLGMTEKSTGADELIAKSAKEVEELLRSVRRLVAQPARRGVSSEKAPARRKAKTPGAA